MRQPITAFVICECGQDHSIHTEFDQLHYGWLRCISCGANLATGKLFVPKRAEASEPVIHSTTFNADDREFLKCCRISFEGDDRAVIA